MDFKGRSQTVKREAGYWRAFFLIPGRNSTQNGHKYIGVT
jgi:hypothetical protein